MEYLLKWKGLDQNGRPWENTWEPQENLHPDTIASYNAVKEMMMNKEPEKKRRSVDKQQPEPAAKKRIVNREKVILSPPLSLCLLLKTFIHVFIWFETVLSNLLVYFFV